MTNLGSGLNDPFVPIDDNHRVFTGWSDSEVWDAVVTLQEQGVGRVLLVAGRANHSSITSILLGQPRSGAVFLQHPSNQPDALSSFLMEFRNLDSSDRSPTPQPEPSAYPASPLELQVRSRPYFEYLEPVVLEVRLRNRSDTPFQIDARLHPEFGLVRVFIQGPGGKDQEYAPILRKSGDAQVRWLLPAAAMPLGSDRYSQEVFVGYGHRGFYFAEPGIYRVWATYQQLPHRPMVSNLHGLWVEPPTPEHSQLAKIFLTDPVGLCLYLGGSSSPYLAGGMEALEELADRYRSSAFGAYLAAVVGQSTASPFFRLRHFILTQTHPPDPQRALLLTEQALRFHQQNPSSSLGYHRLVRQRVGYWNALGEAGQAQIEVGTLVANLLERGVKPAVLEEIKRLLENH